ncbi:MAG: sigma-54-dependent transcriptional regulator [Planctomycetota bacterium]|jgi:two-component system response regulator PilR (NtrC family)
MGESYIMGPTMNGNGEINGRILVVDDEESMREFLSVILKKEGYIVDCAAGGEEAFAKAQESDFDLILEDLKMPVMDGIALLRALKEKDPEVLVIIMTAYSTWDSAVEAMRLGAYDYIRKPFDNNDIKATVARAIGLKRLHEESMSPSAKGRPRLTNLVGHSQQMQEVFDMIRRVAPTDSTVLIVGESGTGKELVARALHDNSLRREQSFLSVNCGAFTETLLESELFGHVRGAFTGAVSDKKSLFEVANKGTLFLDEVGEMQLNTQVKFLRVLENREFIPVGSTVKKRADVRFITATNKDLRNEVEAGTFREDLYYRLNVIPIHLPPLRVKKEDIPLLAGHFLAKCARSIRRGVKGFSEEAMEALMRYDWPGNVRELDNVIQRAVTLCEGNKIEVGDLMGQIRSLPSAGRMLYTEIPEEGLDLDQQIKEIERSYIELALKRTEGNLTRAAALLKMSLRSMRYKVKKYGIRPK